MSAPSAPSSLCGKPTRRGTPCAQVVGAAGCLWHDRATTPEARALVATTGGEARRLVLPHLADPAVDTPAAVRRLLSATIGQVRRGELATPIGAVVISGVRAAIELGELEISAKIAQLERLVASRGSA